MLSQKADCPRGEQRLFPAVQDQARRFLALSFFGRELPNQKKMASLLRLKKQKQTFVKTLNLLAGIYKNRGRK